MQTKKHKERRTKKKKPNEQDAKKMLRPGLEPGLEESEPSVITTKIQRLEENAEFLKCTVLTLH